MLGGAALLRHRGILPVAAQLALALQFLRQGFQALDRLKSYRLVMAGGMAIQRATLTVVIAAATSALGILDTSATRTLTNRPVMSVAKCSISGIAT